jgi:Big-like domain-containing protein
MKRQFARIERRALLGIAAVLATLGIACSPNNSVKPGAPVLTAIDIVENPYIATNITSIPANVTDCPSAAIDDGGADDGGAKDGATGGTTAAATGGMCDPAAVPICRQVSAKNWCRCVANTPPSPPAAAPSCTDAGTPEAGAVVADASVDAASADASSKSDAAAPLGGTWNCDPFAPTSVALFVFDRLLDTAPFDLGDAGGSPNVATTMISPTPPNPVAVVADYASNGSANEIIFPLLGAFRSDGPSLLFAGQPTLPTAAAVTVTLDPTKVRAKDGKTAFTGTGFFKAGSLTYTTAAFTGSITAPPTTPLAADAGTCAIPPTTVTPNKTPATITFNNLVDPTSIATHVTVTMPSPVAGGMAVSIPFMAASADGLNVSITPNASWPASSTITITLDPMATDLDGDAVGAVMPVSFTTGAS